MLDNGENRRVKKETVLCQVCREPRQYDEIVHAQKDPGTKNCRADLEMTIPDDDLVWKLN
mgnify:CR=1 FL=1